MINPTPTTCIATSLGIPKSEQARGIRRSEPPATPDAPQAETADNTLSIMAEGISMSQIKGSYFCCGTVH